MASSQKVLMGLGARSLELDWDAELYAKLVKGAVIEFYKGETLDDAWVILQRTPDESGIALAGVGLDWELGLEAEGPVIEDGIYIVGNNKLANPGFELGDLYFRLADQSAWVIRNTSISPHAGEWAALVDLDPVDEAYLPLDDDILDSDEPFTVRPGIAEQYRLSAWVKRIAGAVGRLRLRALFEGHFSPENKMPAFDSSLWLEISAFSGDAAIDDGPPGVMRLGPCTRQQLVPDYAFADGSLSPNWVVNDGSWSISVLGSPMVSVYAAEAAPGDPRATLTTRFSFSVHEGDEFELRGWSYPHTGADGEAYIQYDQSGPGIETTHGYTDRIPGNATTENNWQEMHDVISIRPGVDTLSIFLILDDCTVGGWAFSGATLTRTKENRCGMQWNYSGGLTPGRSYEGSVSVVPGANFLSGAVKVIAAFGAAGRDPVNREIASIDVKAGETTFPTFTVKAPSGYDEFYIRFAGDDLIGDSVTLTGPQLRDSDTTTMVFDTKSAETQASYVELSLDVEPPTGAERLRCQLVAESQSPGWTVDDVGLARTDLSNENVADIVGDLLHDFETGNLLLTPGAVHGDDYIAFDWPIINTHNRDALRHLLEGGVAPTLREWRVNPDATIDVGTAAEICSDRTDLVFTASDIEVLEAPEITEDATNRATHIKVIGATRKRANGDTFTITATAVVPWAEPMLDLFGEPLHRVRIVENSTINHPDYAQALADFLAAKEAEAPKACTLKLSSDRARGATFREGDWIYVHAPLAGLEDLDNGQTAADGAVIFPERLRVLSRRETYGEGDCSASLRQVDGTRVPLDNVRWADRTEVEVQLGTYVPDFVTNDLGGAAFTQFLRYRSSVPR